MKVVIPIIAEKSISIAEFKKRLAKYLPSSPPKFALGDVAIRDSILKCGSPVIITGIRSAHTSGIEYKWHYDVLGINENDGSYAWSQLDEDKLRKVTQND